MWFGNRLAPHPRLTVHALDVRKLDDFDLSGYDTILHLANIANDPSVELNPYASWEVNVLAGMRLVDRAARQGVKQFIFASSASVYGVKSEPRVTEDLELFPLSEYNKTKMVAERVVLSYSDSMVTTHHPAGHRVRLLAAHAPRRRRQHADDAGAEERRDHRARRRSDAAEHPHRRSGRPLPVCDRYAASPASSTPASRTSASVDIAEAVTREIPATIETSTRRTIRDRTRCAPTSCWPPVSRRAERCRWRFARWSRRTATAGSSTSPFVTMCAGCGEHNFG